MPKKKPVPEQKVAYSRAKIGGEVPVVVNEIMDRCLYSGLFGVLDSARMQAITEKILDIVTATGIEMIIIDLGSVDIIDSAVAGRLAKLGDTLRLAGVKIIICGIQPFIAQTMANAGVSLERLKVSRNLKSALEEVFAIEGLELVPVRSAK